MAMNFSIVVYDSNATTKALTGDRTKLVRYYSNAYCAMAVSSDSPLDNDLFIIRNGKRTIYGKTGTFNNVENDTFTFSAEDSNGNYGTATHTATMIPYVKLTCNMVNNRPDANGNMSVQCFGSFFNGDFGKELNYLQVAWRYKAPSGSWSDWELMPVYKTGNLYNASYDFQIPNFNYNGTYVFECRATDALLLALGLPEVTASSAVKSTPVFHWGENDFKFEVPVDMAGDLRLKGSENYGRTLRFGEGDYCYIAEKSDDNMTLKATRICLDADLIYVNDKSLPALAEGSWTPKLSSSAISYHTTNRGWYSKVGQTVCVGFYIKATCNSGYDGTNISISGLPYTPTFPTAGGGMCSGAYVSGGFNFQCFVAETSGIITTRVQACNNTSATNLSTSASGCNYRSGGGEITLSGTITFMTNS